MSKFKVIICVSIPIRFSCFSNIFETIELDPLDSCEEPSTDSHELMIKRLHRELSQRQELQAELVSILQKKQQTEVELAKKKLKIENLRAHIQNLIKVKRTQKELIGLILISF